MKTLIERQLLKPAIILGLVALMQLMVSLDFNMGQVTLVALAKGARHVRDMLSGSHTCNQ